MTALPCPACGEDVAYVMFTSGSTGRPKGIAIPHRAIVALVRNTDYISLSSGNRVAQASNCGFDAATFEIWGALINGATLVGIDWGTLLSPAHLATSLREQRIDVLFVTTALFNQTALHAPDAFSTLGVLIFGGEAVDPRRVRQVLDAGPPRRLLHAYGPTECTTFATIHEVSLGEREATSLPIGRPIANTTTYVLDGDMRPVAPLHIGELHIGGGRLAHGYDRHPVLTAERFVPDPFSNVPGARMYRTGDKVRWLSGGRIEFIGRYDRQVKLRGYRIELGEIEERLVRLPGVREAVALLRPDAGGEPAIVAYAVIERPGESTLQELQGALRQVLPSYMQPALVLLPSLPLNRNGKIDQAALPEPVLGQPAADQRAPLTDAEQRLLKIWQEILGPLDLRADAGFFEHGGNSLRATQLVSRICREFRVDIPLRAVFERPTIAEQAAMLDAQTARPIAPPTIGRAARQRRVE
jgi:amino acid adenylation domain-containing protein